MYDNEKNTCKNKICATLIFAKIGFARQHWVFGLNGRLLDCSGERSELN